MDKQQILDEIRRTTHENGGAPLGQGRFAQETGIKRHDWIGKIWARWGDALKEAGFEPNKFQTAYGNDYLIEKFVNLARELSRFPVDAEIRIRGRNDAGFPAPATFARLGTKPELAAKILAYCEQRSGHEDIVALCEPIIARRPPQANDDPAFVDDPSATKSGSVYMAVLKLGRERRYKIGKAVLVGRRTDQISLQLPENLELVHEIRTDDAYGIESYWHKRFAAKNSRGEWFSLSREEIQAFKRRKFM